MAWTRRPHGDLIFGFSAKNGTGSDIEADVVTRINHLNLSTKTSVPNGWDGTFDFDFGPAQMWRYRNTSTIGTAYNMGEPVFLAVAGTYKEFLGYAMPTPPDSAEGADFPALADGTEVIASTAKVFYVAKGLFPHPGGMDSITLADSATTFAVTAPTMVITAAGGGNTIATITGAPYPGFVLNLIGVNGAVLSNDDTHAANTIDSDGANDITLADDTVASLLWDGTSWYRIADSIN